VQGDCKTVIAAKPQHCRLLVRTLAPWANLDWGERDLSPSPALDKRWFVRLETR
jgi:hypothetical protein